MTFALSRQARIARRLERIQSNLDKMLLWAGDDDLMAAAAPGVSGWRVGEHLEHLSITDTMMVENLVAQLDAGGIESGGRPTPMGRLFLLMRRIPRGRGKATRPIRPSGVSGDEIRARLEAVRKVVTDLTSRVDELATVSGRREHLVFGWLDARQWLLFLDVHEKHHLAIASDILARR